MHFVRRLAYGLYDWCTGGPRKRARQLLLEHLSSGQLAQFRRHGFFDVIGGSTQTQYRVHQRVAVNVEAMHNGRVVRCLCFGPVGALPSGDVLLAQKLALELSEAEVLQIANIHHPILVERRNRILWH